MNEIFNNTEMTLEQTEAVKEQEVKKKIETVKDVRLNSNMKIYINKVCQAFIAPFSDLKKIEYARNAQTEKSVVRLQDAYGQSHFFEITGMDYESVGMALAKFIAAEKPTCYITDMQGKKEAASMFDIKRED